MVIRIKKIDVEATKKVQNTFDVPTIKNPDKLKLEKTSIKIYKTQLNKLAKMGFSNIDILQQIPVTVVREINKLLEGQDNRKFRLMYSAIFYALADTDYTKKQNPYRTDFTRHRDPEEIK